MPEAIRNVVDLFVQEIRNVLGEDLKKVIVYGILMPEVIIGKAQMWMLWY